MTVIRHMQRVGTANEGFVNEFVATIEALNDRFVGCVDTSYAQFYYSKGLSALEGAMAYLNNRPKEAHGTST